MEVKSLGSWFNGIVLKTQVTCSVCVFHMKRKLRYKFKSTEIFTAVAVIFLYFAAWQYTLKEGKQSGLNFLNLLNNMTLSQQMKIVRATRTFHYLYPNLFLFCIEQGKSKCLHSTGLWSQGQCAINSSMNHASKCYPENKPVQMGFSS